MIEGDPEPGSPNNTFNLYIPLAILTVQYLSADCSFAFLIQLLNIDVMCKNDPPLFNGAKNCLDLDV